MKYLLLIVFLACAWWVWKKRKNLPDVRVVPECKVENMETCAHCGVLFPESDGLRHDGKAYCCEAHRDAARSGAG